MEMKPPKLIPAVGWPEARDSHDRFEFKHDKCAMYFNEISWNLAGLIQRQEMLAGRRASCRAV